MARLELSDTFLEVRTEGKGAPVLLSPGLAGLRGFWAKQVPALTRRFHVITYDHRGCGESSHDLVPYSIPSMAKDVVSLLDRLEIDRVALVGHSTGGAIGQYLAAHHSERISALVLSCSWDRSDRFFKQLFTLRRRVLQSLGPEEYSVLGTLLLWPPKHLGDYPELLTPKPVDSAVRERYVEICLRRIDAIVQFDSSTYLEQIAVPTFVIGAEDDAVTPVHFSRRLAASIRGAKLSVFKYGGHYCPVVQSDSYNDQLGRFLKSAI